MSSVLFRLRINFQKHDRLSLLSHLELVRAMERIVRRAQLPYAVSQGFNAHMRHASSPALPVGTAGLSEFFDVWITEYICPNNVLERLVKSSVVGITVLGVSYVSPSLKGLSATHIHAEYEVVLKTAKAISTSHAGKKDVAISNNNEDDKNAALVQSKLKALIDAGELKVIRKKKTKVYDLKAAIESNPDVRVGSERGELIVCLKLKTSEQGSIKPELLINEAITQDSPLTIKSIARTKLYSDEA